MDLSESVDVIINIINLCLDSIVVGISDTSTQVLHTVDVCQPAALGPLQDLP